MMKNKQSEHCFVFTFHSLYSLVSFTTTIIFSHHVYLNSYVYFIIMTVISYFHHHNEINVMGK